MNTAATTPRPLRRYTISAIGLTTRTITARSVQFALLNGLTDAETARLPSRSVDIIDDGLASDAEAAAWEAARANERANVDAMLANLAANLAAKQAALRP